MDEVVCSFMPILNTPLAKDGLSQKIAVPAADQPQTPAPTSSELRAIESQLYKEKVQQFVGNFRTFTSYGASRVFTIILVVFSWVSVLVTILGWVNENWRWQFVLWSIASGCVMSIVAGGIFALMDLADLRILEAVREENAIAAAQEKSGKGSQSV